MTSSTGEERSAYDRVPVWDGTPSTYRRFETAVEWWLEAENLDVPLPRGSTDTATSRSRQGTSKGVQAS